MGGSYLFTATHSVRSLRRGEPKQADMGTGGLAEALARTTGGLALTAVGRQSGDPNWDLGESPFKREVANRLAGPAGSLTVIDLHGFSADWDEDLILGLGPAPNPASCDLAARLLASAGRGGLCAKIGPPFSARWPGTITAAVQRAGGTALQVEVAGRRRRPRARPAEALAVITALLAAFGAPVLFSGGAGEGRDQPACGSRPSPC